MCIVCILIPLFFFFNDTPTTDIYTLSLHDALPIFLRAIQEGEVEPVGARKPVKVDARIISATNRDRKSTRLNSSHTVISYAVFCLKKKKKKDITQHNKTQQEGINKCVDDTIRL